MQPGFQFLGFEPAEDLRRDAESRLERLLDQSPYGSAAVALLQKDVHGYRCAISLYSRHGPFIGEASKATPQEALQEVSQALAARIGHWREERTRSLRSRGASGVLEPVA